MCEITRKSLVTPLVPAEWDVYRQIYIEGPAAKIRVGGLFRARDARTFAETVAATYGLSLQEMNGRIVLSGAGELATEESFDRSRRR